MKMYMFRTKKKDMATWNQKIQLFNIATSMRIAAFER